MLKGRHKQPIKRLVRCYLCGAEMSVSHKAMSTTCPGCHKAIKIERVVVKSYVPVVNLQTCGSIHITKRGRVSASRIQCGGDILIEGTVEGVIEADGTVRLGPKAKWKGKTLLCRALEVDTGAKLLGDVEVPWIRPQPPPREQPRRRITALGLGVPTPNTVEPKIERQPHLFRTTVDLAPSKADPGGRPSESAPTTKKVTRTKPVKKKAASKKPAAKRKSSKKTAGKRAVDND